MDLYPALKLILSIKSFHLNNSRDHFSISRAITANGMYRRSVALGWHVLWVHSYPRRRVEHRATVCVYIWFSLSTAHRYAKP